MRMRSHARVKWQNFPVKTWCRICGAPVLLQVKNNYEHALRYAYRLDDSAIEHNGHAEMGGWGVHWRLDDVLRFIFPKQHTEDLWPMPAWYEHETDVFDEITIAAEDEPCIDERRRQMIHAVNSNPKSREELEQLGQVWDAEELRRDFEVLGYRAPFVVVERRSDGARGSLLFQHEPRYHFEFTLDRVL